MSLPLNQVLLGDAIELMRTLPDGSIDAVISDPPYNTTKLKFDCAIDWQAFWAEANRVCKLTAPMVMFAAQPFATDLINSNRKAFHYELIWEKTMPTGFLDANRRPMRAHENILFFCRKWYSSTYNPQKTPTTRQLRKRKNGRSNHYGAHGKSDSDNHGLKHPRSVLQFRNVNRGFDPDAVHPTQKPIDLVKFLVGSYSNPGAVILDPFLGSGTTAIAAIETGRNFIGIERDQSYHAIALERIAKAQEAVA